MSDDWDNDDFQPQQPTMMKGVSEGGTTFSAGRGFKAVESNGDGWGSGGGGGGGGWGDDNQDSFGFGGGGWGNDNQDQGYGGGGGGRPRGGRGGRGGGDRRGGRGGGRGGYRDNNRDFGNGNADSNGDSWKPKDSGGGGGGWGDTNDDGFGGGGGDEHRGGGRGRGRGGRGRGGRGGRDNDGGGGNSWGGEKTEGGGGEEEKPREIYVPVERVADDDLFTTTISSGVNFTKLDDIAVQVTGDEVPPPMTSFEDSGLREHLIDNVRRSKYATPTPVQKYAIPIILAGRDLMACAQTGSGKTAAFLLPMIHKILENQDPPLREGNTAMPQVVVVSPTRELAVQIYEQAKKFSFNSIVKVAVAYGGTAVHHQRRQMMAGCHILVATPGRLNDFVKHGHVGFSAVQFFVLDEADRMLDMGFLPTIEEMLGHETMKATGERQTLMFSATFPEQIQHLASKFLHDYAFVTVGIVGSASTDVEQNFFEVSKFEKRNKLLDMLRDNKERTIVFVETKRNADFLATLLCENEMSSTSIHGDRLQSQREEALWEFKTGVRNILVATGVAARGLDIKGIEHVINYDLPKNVDEYVHRIGRTGRVGNRGKATSFYDSAQDGALAGQLANILRQAGQEVPDFLSRGGGGGYSGGGEDSFGGRDIRGDDYGQGQQQQQAAPIEDDW